MRAWFAALMLSALVGLPCAAQDREGDATVGVPVRTMDGTARTAFGAIQAPALGAARIIGGTSRGCLAGAVQLPTDGPNWQTMRPSRNRAWGHPTLVDFVRSLAAAAGRSGGGILVGDMSQPRGGPMPSGHSSHQVGLDVDVWFAAMPSRRLSRAERDTRPLVSTLSADKKAVDPARLGADARALVRAAARDGRVARIFVHPLVKRALCASAGADRSWLRKVRPWYGHDEHFHVRLKCPQGQGECKAQRPPPAGDGCGADLDYWFTPAPYRARPQAPPLPLAGMPAACIALATGAAGTD